MKLYLCTVTMRCILTESFIVRLTLLKKQKVILNWRCKGNEKIVSVNDYFSYFILCVNLSANQNLGIKANKPFAYKIKAHQGGKGERHYEHYHHQRKIYRDSKREAEQQAL